MKAASLNAHAWLAAWTASFVISAHADPSSGIVADKNGQIFFADERRNIIWKVDTNGALSQFMTGKHAHLLEIDAGGNLFGEHARYIADGDRWEGALWKCSPTGKVTDIFGPVAGFPPGLLQDQAGNRYKAASSTTPGKPTRIVRRTPDGAVEVFVGGEPGFKDARGSAARLSRVVGMTWGANDTLYFTDENHVRMASVAGEVTTLGTVTLQPRDQNLPGDIILWGLTVTASGEVYAAHYARREVVKISQNRKVTTVARTERPWSATGVAAWGKDVFVLEHGFTPPATSLGPRVRKVSADGHSRILATVNLAN